MQSKGQEKKIKEVCNVMDRSSITNMPGVEKATCH